jgi:hypothetical protein
MREVSRDREPGGQSLHVGSRREVLKQIRRWCDRHLPSPSRRFRKYGRDTVLGPLFTLCILLSVARWWSVAHGEGSVQAALGWTAAAGVAMLLGKRRWLVAACPFGYVAFQSHIHLLLGGGGKFFIVGTGAAAIAVALCAIPAWREGPPEKG